jgi:hypothetical protein
MAPLVTFPITTFFHQTEEPPIGYSRIISTAAALLLLL